MKKLYLLLAVSLNFIAVNAQERYKILYDYQSENVFYYSLDKNNNIVDTLDKPRFKKNSMIEIQVLNVNPFAVDVETEVSEENIHKSSAGGFNFGSLLGGIGSFSKESLNLNVGGLPVSDSLFSRGAKSRGAGLSNKFEALNDLSTNVSTLKNTLVSNLKNPHLTKEEIKNNLQEIAGRQEDVRLPDPKENFYAYLANLQKIAETSKSEIVNDLKILKTDLAQSEDSSVASRGELVLRNTSYAELENLLQAVQNSTTQSIESINEIENLYGILEGSTFSRTYDYYVTSDKSNIELTFKESAFATALEASDVRNTLRTRNIKIFSKGGFKINTGIALTMNNFENSSNDFFLNEEGVIHSTANDYFIPNLSTMINFYPIISQNFNLGGSFGLSIPISNNVSGVNFLLGPSIFLGNDSRLSLSGGVAYGPVERLTNGLRVGEPTSYNSLDPYTQTVYDLGYFFGISFSIFDIN